MRRRVEPSKNHLHGVSLPRIEGNLTLLLRISDPEAFSLMALPFESSPLNLDLNVARNTLSPT
jgi:hypothetical protein